MLRDYPPAMPWAIIQIRKEWFALAAQDVREMLRVPDVTRVPNVPDYVRGVIDLRGQVLSLIDLRRRLGMTSADDEIESFQGLMAQREQDHRKWLAELEASVKERREFALTTDPHKCAFGKWYDAYQPENAWVAALLKKFDEPHKKIHGTGAEVKMLVGAGDCEKAAQLIENKGKTLLSAMIELFADLKSLVKEVRHEIAVVLVVSGKTFAVCADAAIAVEKSAPGSLEPLPAEAAMDYGGVVQRAVRRMKDAKLLLIIEADRLLERS